jgi:hypothetical protein
MTTLPSSQVSENDIQKAIDDYLQNVPSLFKKSFLLPPPSEENYMFNLFGQEKYLLITKFDLAKLPAKILKRLSVHLLKQFAVQVEVDSLWYWALTHDIVISPAGRMVFEKWPIENVLSTLLAAHFAKLSYPPWNWAIDRLNKVMNDIVSEPVKELVLNRDIIVMYLCFPVLEGLIKFAMSSVVDLDGRVRVLLSDGKQQFRPGKQIRSLAVLLRILETTPALSSDPDLATNLKDFRLQVELIAPPSQFLPAYKEPSDGWEVIYYLRNVALHGAKETQLRSGLLTNLICLIVWHLMNEKAVNEELSSIATRPREFKFPNWYYPPEL